MQLLAEEFEFEYKYLLERVYSAQTEQTVTLTAFLPLRNPYFCRSSGFLKQTPKHAVGQLCR